MLLKFGTNCRECKDSDDDPAVRKRARAIEEALGEVVSGAEVKV